jgi:hypothetical protein
MRSPEPAERLVQPVLAGLSLCLHHPEMPAVRCRHHSAIAIAVIAIAVIAIAARPVVNSRSFQLFFLAWLLTTHSERRYWT